MIPKPYEQLTDLEILSLCVWREARGETAPGQRAVAHVVRNRTFTPKWWNGQTAGSYHKVILFPYQFSSFNLSDPQHDLWPNDDLSFTASKEAALWVPCGMDPDNTDSAVMYHDISIGFPPSWGNESDYINTLNVGRLKFYKPK